METNFDEVLSDLSSLPLRRHRRVWEPFMRKYDCQIIAELGVCTGENFRRMIAHSPKEAYAIDAWKHDDTKSHNDGGYTQEELDKQCFAFAEEVENYPFVTVIRDYTFNAVENFKDEYFDLIYIDADHTYDGCMRDILDWYPKVKSGRFLLGDDYQERKAPRTGVRFGVIQAVNDFVEKNNLKLMVLPWHGWGVIKP